MRRILREKARMDLEQQLRPLRRAQKARRPTEGWLRAMRQATGISVREIAEYMQFTPKMVFQMERRSSRIRSRWAAERYGAGDAMRPGVRSCAVAALD